MLCLGDLYIGKYPTRDRNSYLVLYLNFSGIVGELHNYRKGLDAHCQTTFENFCKIYADCLPPDTLGKLRTKDGAVEQLEFLLSGMCSCQSAHLSLPLMNTTTLLMLSSRMLRE